MGNQCSHCSFYNADNDVDGDYMCEHEHFLCYNCREHYDYDRVRNIDPNACYCCDNVSWEDIQEEIMLNSLKDLKIN